MSWSYEPLTVPGVWLDAAMSDPADCPVCGLSDGTSSDGHGLADSAADCLAHWLPDCTMSGDATAEEPTVPEINAAIRYELGRLA